MKRVRMSGNIGRSLDLFAAEVEVSNLDVARKFNLPIVTVVYGAGSIGEVPVLVNGEGSS